MGSLAPVQCPACGYRGDEEICPQCGFPIGRYRDFLSGVPVLADEAWKRELEEQVRRHRIVYQQRFAAPIPPGTLVVAPDGSGNFRSLEEAVRRAQPGAVIYLKAGIHRLKRPLGIGKPMTLIREGMETTRIVCDGEEYVMKFSGNGLFSAGDLAFVHEGAKWGGAVRANMGEIRFYRRLFKGGVWDEANQRSGDGLWLYGTARGDVRERVASGNEGVGIRVSGEAQPTLEGNTCRENNRSFAGMLRPHQSDLLSDVDPHAAGGFAQHVAIWGQRVRL
jgi:parallel beta-helix repeat protein